MWVWIGIGVEFGIAMLLLAIQAGALTFLGRECLPCWGCCDPGQGGCAADWPG
jgi:hypothetical protein